MKLTIFAIAPLAVLLVGCGGQRAIEAGAAISGEAAARRAAGSQVSTLSVADLTRDCGRIGQAADRAVLLTRLCSSGAEGAGSLEETRRNCVEANRATHAAGDLWLAVRDAVQTPEVAACRDSQEGHAERIIGAMDYQIALIRYSIEDENGKPAPYSPAR
ncbi:MAG: hypothetical protein Q8J89_00090 [Caulobacter sp.]|nr:hypothetical protein [Caulobacter sp.]